MSNPNRYCDSCKHDHGPLYICPSYSQELKKDIQKQSYQFKKNLQDPEWIKKQNVPTNVIEVFKFFSRL